MGTGQVRGDGSNRDIPVSPGQVVRFGGWALRESGDGLARWYVEILDSNRNPINWAIPSPANATTGTWELMQGTATMPAGAAYIRFYCEIKDTTVSSTVRFDDAYVWAETHYYLADRLGSTRVVASASGATERESDYFPYGKERVVVNGDANNRFFFTGYEHDADGSTSLEHTLFRQYSTTEGRFCSIDPVAGDITNPQSLNRYAYVRNNPSNLIDPLGLRVVEIGNCTFEFLDYYVDGEYQGTEVYFWGCRGDGGDAGGGGEPTIGGGGSPQPQGPEDPLKPVDVSGLRSTTLNNVMRLLQPIYCDDFFIRQASRAWQSTGNGLDQNGHEEAGFAIALNPNGSLGFGPTATSNWNENRQTSSIRIQPIPYEIAVFHTHGVRLSQVPSRINPATREGDVYSPVPVYLGVRTGELYVTDPATNTYHRVRNGGRDSFWNPCR